jgi:hypothetical protein
MVFESLVKLMISAGLALSTLDVESVQEALLDPLPSPDYTLPVAWIQGGGNMPTSAAGCWSFTVGTDGSRSFFCDGEGSGCSITFDTNIPGFPVIVKVMASQPDCSGNAVGVLGPGGSEWDLFGAVVLFPF